MTAKHNLMKVFSVIAILAMTFSNIQSQHVEAQSGDGLNRQVNAESGRVSFITAASGKSLSAARALGESIRPQDPAMALAARYAPEFGLKEPQRNLTAMESNRGEDGRITARFQQNYENVPVMGGELIVNTNDSGDLYSISGEVSPDLSLSTQPAVDAGQAQQTALQAVSKWYGKAPEDFVSTAPALWIYDESLLQPSTRPVELTWRMEVTAKDGGMPVRELVLVNAQRGSISLHFNQIDSVWTTSAADSSKGTSTADTLDVVLPVTTAPASPKTGGQPVRQAEATATLLYVSTTGNDSNTCELPASPCATINAAIEKAASGATIRIATGTYTGIDTVVIYIGKDITLSAGWNAGFTAQSGLSTIDGQYARTGIIVESNVEATIERVLVQNSADTGIVNRLSATLTLNKSVIYRNQEYGISNVSNLTLNESTVSDNANSGIRNNGTGTVTLNNSTISNNVGKGGGGAISNDGTIILNNSTISGNTVLTGAGGGINNSYGSVTIRNSIVAGNTASFGGPDCYGSVVSAGYNLIGNVSGCTFTSGTGDLTNTDPKLGALIGLPGYLPLLSGSPAIDTGNPAAPGSGGNACLSSDERGIGRPVAGRCDIGAYEYTVPGSLSALLIVDGDQQHTAPGSAFPLPMKVAAVDSQGSPVAGVSVTFTAPGSGASGTFAATGTRTTSMNTAQNGMAITSIFTANGVLGSYSVTASASGAGAVNFSLSNTVFFVAATGNDANDCRTPATACATLHAAIGKATFGDTIEISEGTYSSHNPSGGDGFQIQKPLTIRGGWNASFTSQTGMTTLDGQGTFGSIISISQNAVLERLRLQSSGYNGLTIWGNVGISVLLKQIVIDGNAWSGIELLGGSFKIENSTISGNGHEGIRVSSGNATVTNSTISGNAVRGIVSYSSQGAVSIQNTILSGNTEGKSPLDCYGIASLGNNLIGTTNNCYITVQGSDLVGVDPQMSGLIGSGYYALSAGSPAIGAANVSACPATDQRGTARLDNGACDIGAFEYTVPGAAASLAVYSGNNQSAAPNQPFYKPLKVQVLDAKGNLVPNVNVTFTAPASGASGTFAASGTRTTSVPTDAYGIAAASTFTANSQYGAYTVTASAAGLASVNFSLANRSLFVSPAGNDSNNCTTAATPCATINGAVAKAVDGDTIEVAEGTYTGTGTEAALLNKSVRLIGGWNPAFTSQTGYSTIDGQAARRGVYISAADVELSRFKVQNCQNSGIYIASLPAGAVINESMIFNNNSGDGGGIYNEGSLVLNNSSVLANNAQGYGTGGGIHNRGNVTITNSTISGNKAYYGGGISNTRTVNLNNVTIADNQAPADGGGIYQTNGTLTIRNSIVARNSSYWSSKDCYSAGGSLVSYDYNLIGVTGTCTFNVSQAGHDLLNLDAQLGILNPTLGFVPLQETSPAIDAGNPATPGSGGNACLGVDQRGVTRPVDGPDADTVAVCDMGAVEYTPAGPVAKILYSAGSPQTVAPNSKLPVHPQVIVTDSSGNPKPNVTVTFTAPTSGPSGAFVGGSNVITVLTDGSGVATAPDFVTNGILGSYQIIASVEALAETVSFSITQAYWYVAVGGNDASDCTSVATACATVQGVLAKPVFSGGSILVRQGLYNTAESVGLNKNVTVSGGWNASFTSQAGTSVFEDPFSVYPAGVSATVENVTVRNSIGTSGISNSGTLVLKNSSIINNNSGIYNTGDLTIVNSTISGNGKMGLPPSYGGGIQNTALSAHVLLLNSTVTNNAANNAGGIFTDSTAGGTVTLQNSIVAGNTATYGAPDCQGGDYSGTLHNRGLFVSLGNNIIGDIGTYNGAEYPCRVTWLGSDVVGDHAKPVKANLDVLADAGNNNWVHRLKLGSPAIESVLTDTCPVVDQLGLTRPQGRFCDSGAVEFVFDRNLSSLLISTYNGGHTTNLPGTFVCNQSNPTCSNGDTHAKAAHQYAIGTYNLFKSKHGRNSIDGHGFEINSTVHYSSSYANAFWNGYMMVYGDKYGYPLADDVVAHELTHGVTQYESNLYYYYQAGAINESFSDLWGEYYDQTNAKGNDTAGVKWLLGEDVSGYPKPAGFTVPAMRSMSNPPALGDPDKMTSTYYYKGEDDNGGVHTNSGVNNKAVFLMVQGGTFNGKTVTALGWDKTAAIYYEANTNLLTSAADYSDLYYALQSACASLISQKGIIGGDCTQVKNAIDAVQMNAQPATNFNPDAPQCPTYGSYPDIAFGDDLENGTANWTFVNGTYPRWQYDSPYGQFAQSGQHSLYADDYPQFDNQPTDATATLVSFTVPDNAYLWFAHAYDFETGYEPNDPTLYNFDGGLLEYSTNAGSTWVDAAPLIEYNGYKGKVYNGYGNPLSGKSAFVGASHGYISTRLNLSSLAGQDVSFRWRMGLDGGFSSWGWWVDNIQAYTCIATTFADVPPTHPYYDDIEILYANNLTGGCATGPLKFCPDQIMNRAQAAAFMLRGNFGPSYVPPVPQHIFLDDWSKGPWAESWAEGMRAEGFSAGCTTNPLKYCPWDQIPREQAVIFALKLKYGKDYMAPAATGTVFADMTNPGYYATSWAETAYKEGIVKDCGVDSVSGKPNFCPKALVSRGLAAYMIVRAKGLSMP